MKKQIILTLMCLFALVGAAKELRTLRVTTAPRMTCQKCETRIKKNLRFEKGVQSIATDLKDQVVTVVYDADKTDESKLVKAFEKIKYQAIVLGENEKGTSKAINPNVKPVCE